jgi:hypothetical protein
MSIRSPQRKGTIIEWPQLTIFDTREMEWEPVHEWGNLPDLKSAVRKVLVRDEAGYPFVMLNYFPAGFNLPNLPYRHYHSTAGELGYRLWGNLPHWEYENAAQQHGTLNSGRAGFFMHRLPGSIHGLEPGPLSRTGSCSLSWRTGRGTNIGEPEFEQETVHVPYAEGWRPNPAVEDVAVTRNGEAAVIDWADLKIVDTRRMPWEQRPEWAGRPGLDGACRKVLVREEQGEPVVSLNYLPPGFTLPELPYRHYHSTVSEFSFVLCGELPHWEYESADQQKGALVVFKPGYFMHRRPGSIHGLEPGPVSPCGAFTLSWRTGTGTGIGERNFETETVHVPYA